MISSVYKAFILVSGICFGIGYVTSDAVSFGAMITGYTLLLLSIMLILLILIQSTFRVNQHRTMLQAILTIIAVVGPFLLMLGTIGFLMYLLIYYKTPILEKHVPPSYSGFNNIATGLLILQLYIVYKNINSTYYQKTGTISLITSSGLYLLGVITLGFALILYTILTYFRTDG
jgi:hypothetical protein